MAAGWSLRRVLVLLLLAFLAIVRPPDPAGAGERLRVKSGSGFFVSPDGYLVTGAHVVAGCPAISIWTREGVRHSARVEAVSPSLDVALIRTEARAERSARARYPQLSSVGEEVFGLGYGVVATDPKRPVLIHGTYLGSDRTPEGLTVSVIEARLHEGESGGAVIGADGALLGMMVGRASDRRDRGVMISTPDIDAFLSARGMRLPIIAADGPPAPRDVLMGISVLVQCTSPVSSASPPPHGWSGAQAKGGFDVRHEPGFRGSFGQTPPTSQ